VPRDREALPAIGKLDRELLSAFTTMDRNPENHLG
jgi:hypothetical protein